MKRYFTIFILLVLVVYFVCFGSYGCTKNETNNTESTTIDKTTDTSADIDKEDATKKEEQGKTDKEDKEDKNSEEDKEIEVTLSFQLNESGEGYLLCGIDCGKEKKCDSIIIPSTYNDKSVVGIKGTFARYTIKKLFIPSSVVYIAAYTFDAANIEEVEFENPNGWKVGNSELSSKTLSNSTYAAKYLTVTFDSDDWNRS